MARKPKILDVSMLPESKVRNSTRVWFYPDRSPFGDDVLVGDPKQSYVGQPVKVLSAKEFGAGNVRILVHSSARPTGYAFVYPSDIENGELISGAAVTSRKRKKNPVKRGKLTGAAKAAFLARMAKGRRKAGSQSRARKARRSMSGRKVKFLKVTAQFPRPVKHRARRVRRRNLAAPGAAVIFVKLGHKDFYYTNDNVLSTNREAARRYKSVRLAAQVARHLSRSLPRAQISINRP